MLWLLLLALGQPGECNDRSPGLSKCVEYTPRTVDKGAVVEWNCKAVCYTPKAKGKANDGGTDASILYATSSTQPTCLKALEEKCR